MKYTELFGWGYLIKRRGNKIIFKTKDVRKEYSLERGVIFRVTGVGYVSTKVFREMSTEPNTTYIFKRGPRRVGTRISNYNTIMLRLNQIRAYLSPDHRFSLAKSFVYSALKNKVSMLMFLEKARGYDFSMQMDELGETISKLDETKFIKEQLVEKNIESLMGVEGTGAHIYFQAVSSVIPEDFNFSGRSKRPPTDPVNAALSYGYVFLGNQINNILLEHGFDTRIGFLHEFGRGRASLSLDVLEEFRQPIVDAVVFSLILDKIIVPSKHFQSVGNRVLLNRTGKGIITRALKMAIEKFRRTIISEAQKLLDHLLLEKEFSPFIWRV